MSSGELRDIRYAADSIYRNLPQSSSHPSQRSIRKYILYILINFFPSYLFHWHCPFLCIQSKCVRLRQSLHCICNHGIEHCFEIYHLFWVNIYCLFTDHKIQSISAQERYARMNFLNFITEEYIAGFTQDGQMSNVRRFFCLFVTFDLFFISLLWLIQIMVREMNIFRWLHIDSENTKNTRNARIY